MTARRRGRVKHRSGVMNVFRMCTAFMLLVALCALTRVSVTASIAEATVDAGRLCWDIREEMQLADCLEVKKSVLMSPERLETIASVSMGMDLPDDVAYLSLAERKQVVSEEQVTPIQVADVDDAPFGRIIEAVMDMAAGEAQILLVGDVGLATAR